jgi:HEAT repeat protein
MRRSLALLLSILTVGVACRSREVPPNVSNLMADLQGADAERRGRASLELIRMGEPAAPLLAGLLASEDPELRARAATTLWGMGEKGRAAVPALAAALSDPDPELRISVAMALGNMGQAAAEAVPALTNLLYDPNRSVKQAAVKALGAIGPPARSALPVLNRILRRSSWPEAEEAVLKIRGATGKASEQEPPTSANG